MPNKVGVKVHGLIRFMADTRNNKNLLFDFHWIDEYHHD